MRKQRVISKISWISLILAVGWIYLWWRSYAAPVHLGVQNGRMVVLEIIRGKCRLLYQECRDTPAVATNFAVRVIRLWCHCHCL